MQHHNTSSARANAQAGLQGSEQRTPGQVVCLSVACRSEGLRTAISQSWAQIDVDQSGSLSLADLEGYAKQHGLPREYVQNFVDAVLRASPSAPNAPTTAQPAAQALHADSQQHSDTLTETAAPAPSDGTAAGLSQPHQLQPLVQIQPQPELPLLPPLAALTRWLSPAAGQLQGAAEAAPLELTFSQFETFVKSRETALRKAFDMFDRGAFRFTRLAIAGAHEANITRCWHGPACLLAMS